MAIPDADYGAFAIPRGEHFLAGLLHATRGLWRRLGSLESSTLREKIDNVAVDRPIYIAGLARSGSTILLETIASHPSVATHRYRDFWSIYTPVWAARTNHKLNQVDVEPVERAHQDGIRVTPDSPEAIEEMLWQSFFPHLHDPATSNVLNAESSHPSFEGYYRDHLRKLLLVRDKPRYASKANYNITRLEYLLKLFPDARFVLPIRDPRDHIASLQKQHQMLLTAAAKHPRSVHYLDRVGHFEFGLHRTPINAGNSTTTSQILELWRSGEEIRGWARYWSSLYGFLAKQLRMNDALRRAAIVVRYNDLCDDSSVVLSNLMSHCGLEPSETLIDHWAERLHRPAYYQTDFTAAEDRIIEEETMEVAERFGLGQLMTR